MLRKRGVPRAGYQREWATIDKPCAIGLGIQAHRAGRISATDSKNRLPRRPGRANETAGLRSGEPIDQEQTAALGVLPEALTIRIR
jgi:hypothetical protein